MMKPFIVAGAMIFAGPALAQTIPAAPQTAAPQTAPVTTPADAAPQAADPASATPAPATEQVASAVDQQFATYDKNGDGKLSKAEFGEWMVTLKTASDPATKATSPATKAWVTAAFAQADTDKNGVLSKTEVTGFLDKGKS